MAFGNLCVNMATGIRVIRDNRMMKKTSVRTLMLSCLAVTAIGISSAQAQTSSQTQASEQAMKDFQASMGAVTAANAAAGYTGNPNMAAQTAQPGQAMLPPGMQQPGQMGMYGPFAPAEPEQEIIMRYDKKNAEGAFYGVELPRRLFNNVPSDW